MATKGTVLFTGSTDVTGQELAEALSFNGSKAWDGAKQDVVISWGWSGVKSGTKPADILAKSKTLINSPSAVHLNSDKANAFKNMKAAGVKVPLFLTAEQVEAAVANGQISFPIVGRMKKHMGGKKFHLCLEKAALKNAIAKGCTLFTKYLPKDKEYRIHVMDGQVLQACIKEPQHNPTAGWKKLKTELITEKAKKNNTTLDENTLSFALDYIVGRDFEVPNFSVRSNKLGWSFKFIDSAPSEVCQAAIKACKAVGLDFGAVDLIVTDDKEVVVLEVNSGPGLCTKMLEKYKAGFNALIAKKLGNTATVKAVVTPTSTPIPVAKATGSNKTAKLTSVLSSMSIDEAQAIMKLASNADATALAGLHKLLGISE